MSNLEPFRKLKRKYEKDIEKRRNSDSASFYSMIVAQEAYNIIEEIEKALIDAEGPDSDGYKPGAARKLDELLMARIGRSVTVENILLKMYKGNSPLPDKDKCKELAMKLGIDEVS